MLHRFVRLLVSLVLGAGIHSAFSSTLADIQSVRITADRLAKLPINGEQVGQFIEPLCNLIPSLLAQQVASTSFEEDPPWKVAFKRETDKPYRPWYPDGAVHLGTYSFDTNQPFNGKRSLKIELPTPKARAGISQDGFYLK
ncbi:MAG: hypothetical protein M1608_04415, partial [Candidatus Omnitrophica bacterium]|nr:hypothetical protein [Candidatus Omnitrophota bacterium]